MVGGSPPWAFTEALEHRYFLAEVNAYGGKPRRYYTTNRLANTVYSRGDPCGRPVTTALEKRCHAVRKEGQR